MSVKGWYKARICPDCEAIRSYRMWVDPKWVWRRWNVYGSICQQCGGEGEYDGKAVWVSVWPWPLSEIPFLGEFRSRTQIEAKSKFAFTEKK